MLGKTPFLPLTLRRVPVGTEGAISIEGTVAGAVAASIVAALGAILWRLRVLDGLLPGSGASARLTAVAALLLAVSAIAGSWLESVVGSWNRTRVRPLSNGTLNFLNTAVGALLMFALFRLL